MSEAKKNESVSPERLELESMDIVSQQKAKLKELFPEAITEGGKIDFDTLRKTLGETVDAGKERYGLSWAGKSDCFRTIQRPSNGTLIPLRGESLNFDKTQNVIVEGDNLEVLKLLQKSYLGRIKMIYIDPPYNTGKDFIYPDDYSESLDTYLKYTEQVDEDGRKFSNNLDTDGRFHSKWLSMMYTRLFLARNLLRQDGVIFISIDDNEIGNLLKICDEIFGEENRIACITVVSNLKGRSDDKYIASAHEYLLCYQRGDFISLGLPLSEDYQATYTERDSIGAYRLLGLRKRGAGAKRSDRPNMYYPFFINENTGTVSIEKIQGFDSEVLPKLSDGSDGRWRWGKATAGENIKYLTGKKVGSEGRWDVFEKDYAELDGAERRMKPKSIWLDKEFSNEAGTLELKDLLGASAFSNPKPTELIKTCLMQATSGSDIILDFFAGSGTTGQAVIEQNESDGGNRSFILVQLPEPVTQNNFDTITDITKERIRRVIDRQKEKLLGQSSLFGEQTKCDLTSSGFRAFKLSQSGFKSWNADTGNQLTGFQSQLNLHVSNIDAARQDEDLFFELLIKSGFELAAAYSTVDLEGKKIYRIHDGALLICLEKELTREIIQSMAAMKPIRVVCLDSGFAGNDQLKVNTVETFKAKGITFKTV